MTTPSVIDVTFVDIPTCLVVTALEFKPRITSAVEASSCVHAVVITAAIVASALIYIFTIDLVLSEKVSFPTCTHVTAISIQAHLMASSIIDFTSVDVSAVFAVWLQLVPSHARARDGFSFSVEYLRAFVLTSSVVYRTLQWRRRGHAAVLFVRVISTVIAAITDPYLIYTPPIGTGHLVGAARAVLFI